MKIFAIIIAWLLISCNKNETNSSKLKFECAVEAEKKTRIHELYDENDLDAIAITNHSNYEGSCVVRYAGSDIVKNWITDDIDELCRMAKREPDVEGFLVVADNIPDKIELMRKARIRYYPIRNGLVELKDRDRVSDHSYNVQDIFRQLETRLKEVNCTGQP